MHVAADEGEGNEVLVGVIILVVVTQTYSVPVDVYLRRGYERSDLGD